MYVSTHPWITAQNVCSYKNTTTAQQVELSQSGDAIVMHQAVIPVRDAVSAPACMIIDKSNDSQGDAFLMCVFMFDGCVYKQDNTQKEHPNSAEFCMLPSHKRSDVNRDLTSRHSAAPMFEQKRLS